MDQLRHLDAEREGEERCRCCFVAWASLNASSNNYAAAGSNKYTGSSKSNVH
jgi:predicted adenine nucleotide alpha hydrolase (AANH) superfamily ATPase